MLDYTQSERNFPRLFKMNISFEEFEKKLSNSVSTVLDKFDADDIDDEAVSKVVNSVTEKALVALGQSKDFFTVAGDVPVVGAIASTVALIFAKALVARANTSTCSRLAHRVYIVWHALRPLVARVEWKTISSLEPALESLSSTLSRCQELIERFTSRNFFTKWLKSGADEQEFDELAALLSEDQDALHLGLGVAQFQRQEIDSLIAEKDREKMQRRLARTLKKIETSQAAQLEALGNVKDDIIDAVKAVQAQQLAAIKEEFALFEKRTQSLMSTAHDNNTTEFPRIGWEELEPVFADEQRISSDDTGVVVSAKWMHETVSLKVIRNKEELTENDRRNFMREVFFFFFFACLLSFFSPLCLSLKKTKQTKIGNH